MIEKQQRTNAGLDAKVRELQDKLAKAERKREAEFQRAREVLYEIEQERDSWRRVAERCEREKQEAIQRESIQMLKATDELTQDAQKPGQYDDWIIHDGHEMPESLAPAQLVECSPEHENGFRTAAQWVNWYPGLKYRIPCDSDGVPYCSADGLEEWCQYVAVSVYGDVLQFDSHPDRTGTDARAPETHRRPGDPKHSLMRVFRG